MVWGAENATSSRPRSSPKILGMLHYFLHQCSILTSLQSFLPSPHRLTKLEAQRSGRCLQLVREPEETRTRPVRTGGLLGDLAQGRIARSSVLETVVRHRDNMSAAVPFANQTRARLQARGQSAHPRKCAANNPSAP